MKNIPLVSIIDDDKFFQFNTRLILESTGQIDNILQFSDGEEAIQYLLEHKDNRDKIPDLIFLDLNMPYLDGWQFLDEFMANSFNKNKITIYICTSSNRKLDQERFATYQKLKGFLIKPISKLDVINVINEELKA